MTLWMEWYACVGALRGACTRAKTFMWMTLALVGMSIRADRLGVTSFVRASWLGAWTYRRLLHLFHTPGLQLEKLTGLWCKLAMKVFCPVRCGEYLVLVADGIKVAKEGRKMPGVKRLYQPSGDNAKAPFIMGHSFQTVGLLAKTDPKGAFCVPLASRIHEGVVFSNRDKRTLLDKLVNLFLVITEHLDRKAILVADAYYGSRKVVNPLLAGGHHLLVRIRHNAVAFHRAPKPQKPRRGRPKLYGKKVRLRDLWKDHDAFTEAQSPVYAERSTVIRYRVVDLLWRPVGHEVRFILVDHPTRGRMILMTTHLDLDPVQAIGLYGFRFKIEVSFKQAIHTLGTYAYHFWMMEMTPLSKKKPGNQYLHRKSDEYRDAVRRKLDAYHRYVQLGCIAQGILQHLAVNFRPLVWGYFRSWMRTMKPQNTPTELVVAQALRDSLPDFLARSPKNHDLNKFIVDNADFETFPKPGLVA